MRLVDQKVEVGVLAEARIDAVVVGGVVAVSARGEYRPECDAGGTQCDGVVEPTNDASEAVLVRLRSRVRGAMADEAQRVDLPPDHVLHPSERHGCTAYASAR